MKLPTREVAVRRAKSRAVSAENVEGPQIRQRAARWKPPQQRMDPDELPACSVVPRGAECVAADEDTLSSPPERDFLPTAARADLAKRKRPERPARDDVMRDAEPLCERSAVAIVAVEQLDDSCRLAGSADSFLDSVTVDRVDHPDAAFHHERMGTTLEELVFHQPLESGVELAERNPHGGESMGTPYTARASATARSAT